jgi:hypothetical protein
VQHIIQQDPGDFKRYIQESRHRAGHTPPDAAADTAGGRGAVKIGLELAKNNILNINSRYETAST